MAFILSSALYIFDASGRSRLRWMASSSRGGAEAAADALVFVDLGGTAARQQGHSLRICSSVKVRRSLEEGLGLCSVVAGN